ncbi:MAG: S8 family serine peptidase, partial [Pseudomonadota bacterium]
MKNRLLLLRILVLALPWAWPAAAAAASPSESAAPARVIVKWRDDTATGRAPDATSPRLRSLARRGNRTLERGWNLGGGLSVIQLRERLAGRELDDLLAALRAAPEVEFAAADVRVKPHAYTPNDPLYFTSQWYLRDGQPAAIRAHEAWEITRGGDSPEDSTIIVAVLDTGVDLDHPDLAGKLLPGWDFVSTEWVGNDGDGWDDDPSDPGDYITAEDLQRPEFANNECGAGPNFDQPVDSSWHGTRVAGLIAAASDNGIGIAGVGFHVKVLPVRVLGKCGGYV